MAVKKQKTAERSRQGTAQQETTWAKRVNSWIDKGRKAKGRKAKRDIGSNRNTRKTSGSGIRRDRQPSKRMGMRQRREAEWQQQ